MRPLLRTAAAALALVLASCGGGGEDDPVPSPEPTDDVDNEVSGADDDLVNAIEAYARVAVEGDPQAVADARSEGCAVVETDLEPPAADPSEIAVSDVEAEVDGDEATVSYRLDPAGEQIADERWVLEDGEWKWDNC